MVGLRKKEEKNVRQHVYKQSGGWCSTCISKLSSFRMVRTSDANQKCLPLSGILIIGLLESDGEQLAFLKGYLVSWRFLLHTVYAIAVCYWIIGRRYSHCEFTVKPDGKGTILSFDLPTKSKSNRICELTHSLFTLKARFSIHKSENYSAEAVSSVVFA